MFVGRTSFIFGCMFPSVIKILSFQFHRKNNDTSKVSGQGCALKLTSSSWKPRCRFAKGGDEGHSTGVSRGKEGERELVLSVPF